MATRIEIITIIEDPRAEVRKKKFHAAGFTNVTNVWIVDVYTIDKQLSADKLKKIGEALSNPVTQEFKIFSKPSTSSGKNNSSLSKRSASKGLINGQFSYAIEIGFLPGVTDNVGHTAQEIIEDVLKVKFINGEHVYTSQVTYIDGKILEKNAEAIALSLHNPLIQRATLKNFAQFKKDGGMDVIVPKVKLTSSGKVTKVNLGVSDEELVTIGKAGIANTDGTRRGPLALDLTYMKTIKEYFKKKKRNPTDIELESIAQTWSEHCKHTIFADPIDDIKKGLFKTYIKKATDEIRKKKGKKDFCVSVFTDNSGAIEFDKDYLITHKVETHNSPSALDPFGGAITGIVGVNRDVIGFGLGAKPVANFYGFCFADPFNSKPLYKGKDFTQPMLSSRRIMEGVIEGVNAGGNQSGIPTPQGFIYFDERYRGKPLVFVGTVGLIPKKIGSKKSWIKKAMPGDYIVMVGGRVGKDGIHGATFSSEAMDSGSPATAVQIGDPITQKKLSDALIKEARDQLLYTSITDNGAGGLSCSIAEMAKESGGCIVELEKVPLKYPGLDPWEIWISESQERMTLSVPKNKWKRLNDLLQRRGVEAAVIGRFTKSGKCVVTFKKKKIMDIDMDFLHDGLPARPMRTKMPNVKYPIFNTTNVILGSPAERDDSRINPSTSLRGKNTSWTSQDDNRADHSKTLLTMLSRLNSTSYSFISQQYDHIVQAGLVLPPLQGRGRVNSDTSVFRPLLSSQKGVVLSQGLYPTYSEMDSYAMAAASIDTAIRNAVAAGANPDRLAILDNFCWCSGNDPERLYQLKEAAKACYEIAVAYGTPLISGKDSMFNDFKGYDEEGNPIKISVLPTLLISSIGVVNDSTKVVSLDSKMPGDLVYVLGETFDEIGGSEYFRMEESSLRGVEQRSNLVPNVNTKKNRKLYRAVFSAIEKRLIASSISVSRGGLGIALSKMAIGGMLGLDVSLKNLPGKTSKNESALYAESQGRIVVTVAPENKKRFETFMKGNSFAQLGEVTSKDEFVVKSLKGKTIIDTTVAKLQNAYTRTFRNW